MENLRKFALFLYLLVTRPRELVQELKDGDTWWIPFSSLLLVVTGFFTLNTVLGTPTTRTTVDVAVYKLIEREFLELIEDDEHDALDVYALVDGWMYELGDGTPGEAILVRFASFHYDMAREFGELHFMDRESALGVPGSSFLQLYFEGSTGVRYADELLEHIEESDREVAERLRAAIDDWESDLTKGQVLLGEAITVWETALYGLFIWLFLGRRSSLRLCLGVACYLTCLEVILGEVGMNALILTPLYVTLSLLLILLLIVVVFQWWHLAVIPKALEVSPAKAVIAGNLALVASAVFSAYWVRGLSFVLEFFE